MNWLHDVNEWMEKLNPDVRLLNEGLMDTDMSGWINIGVIKNGSNIGNGGNAYLMVNPNYPKTDDISSFIYRGTGYNTEPDGTGDELRLSEFTKERLHIYDEYKNTYYGEAFLGKQKNDKDEESHEQFMNRLDMSDNNVVLKHDSNYRITDGFVKKGKTNNYSNNSDIGIYFWGSIDKGNDQTNNSLYTYYCLVPKDEVYDFDNDMERFGTIRNAFNKYSYIAQSWKNGKSIVVNSLTPVKISLITDNRTGKSYNANWQEIN